MGRSVSFSASKCDVGNGIISKSQDFLVKWFGNFGIVFGFFWNFCFEIFREFIRVSVQGVKSLGGHFPCLYRGFEFYEVKEKKIVIIFQKENGNTFTLLIIFIVKSLQKEQNSTNLLL